MTVDSHESGDEDHLAMLAAGAAAGDAGAFAVLAHGVRARVVAWAGAITGNRDDAEDVAQVVLLRLSDHVHRFEGRSRFTAAGMDDYLAKPVRLEQVQATLAHWAARKVA